MELLTELLQDAHFWVGVALVLFTLVLLRAGAHTLAAKAIDSRGAKIQGQLDEANRLRAEAQGLLDRIQTQKVEADAAAKEILAAAKAEAKRLAADSQVKLAEQIERRGQIAERKIAQAEVQAAAAVKAAAADLAAQAAEAVLASRLAGAKADPLIDQAVSQLAGKLQ